MYITFVAFGLGTDDAATATATAFAVVVVVVVIEDGWCRLWKLLALSSHLIRAI